MEKYLVSFIVISIVIYSLTYLLFFPKKRTMRILFERTFPDKNEPSELSISQRMEWELLVSENTSSPIYILSQLIIVLVNYPSILIHSVVRGKDEFGGHTMIWTSIVVWWLISLLFL